MKKGFTLIELLVVIAIIGILSGIVLTSLNSARTKANDAKTISQMSSIRAAAEIAYTGSNYGASATVAGCEGLLTSAAVAPLVATTAWTDGVAPVCKSDTTTATGNINNWAMSHVLPSSTTATPRYSCVDSTGVARTTAAAVTTSTCPAAA